MAALSYDSVAVLKNFAARKSITYPLLSDPESNIIRAFGILNQQFQPGQLPYGVPYPGTYIIDEHGIVRDKFFETDYTERYTAASVLVHSFGANGVEKTEVDTRHLKLTSSASDTAAWPGSRITLTLDIDLKPGMHVYAPGVHDGYIPIDWQIAPSPSWRATPAAYPSSTMLQLPVIHETVPVYKDRLHLTRDLIVSPQVAPPSLEVTGTFRYQACDDKECYPPQTIPLTWTLHVEKLDRQRAPVELQRKASR